MGTTEHDRAHRLSPPNPTPPYPRPIDRITTAAGQEEGRGGRVADEGIERRMRFHHRERRRRRSARRDNDGGARGFLPGFSASIIGSSGGGGRALGEATMSGVGFPSWIYAYNCLVIFILSFSFFSSDDAMRVRLWQSLRPPRLIATSTQRGDWLIWVVNFRSVVGVWSCRSVEWL